MVLDLRIAHERVGRSSDPSINGHLRYPNDLDGTLNEDAPDKIRQYRSDYNNRPSNAIFFMIDIPSTSGSLHGEFMRLLFLQAHRETERFFAASGVNLVQSTSDQHGSTTAARRSPHNSSPKSATSLSNLSSINLIFIFRCSSPLRNPVYVRRVDS